MLVRHFMGVWVAITLNIFVYLSDQSATSNVGLALAV
jgi:hypothetical protein